MQALEKALAQVGRVVLGKPEQIKLALACMLAGGHLLIEDLPGMGKTTLAQALARVFRLDYRRVQFTSDMLPADILGVSVFDPDSREFTLREGPVFTQLLLADEINRATPKTQGALLEAMEEQQVSLDGLTRPLPEPFFVVATQNPVTQAGTFVLPESQLDRFLMRISLGYPSPEVERDLLAGGDQRDRVRQLEAAIEPSGLRKLCRFVDQLRATRELIDYVQRLLDATRADSRFVAGLSPRAGLGLLRAARAWALLHGRDYVLPEDVQSVWAAVAEHRLQPREGGNVAAMTQSLLQTVPVVR
ncbi:MULTISPECIES: AAA family ATPase [Alloalcanivorax]|jgi:MoxR-like ATPase|uniref:ATPase, AAA family, putative n=1 Tax=Alcanivorax dieselolei (strain DSM 16502 / CGMCC 1.3690 / MCCC 1A00001 / B-5) TaxID=930169 RepID=K0CEY1_ALCDB|nr:MULTISPECIES: MoxR family ATPase [Alloalcanivorax]ERS12980.1 ATPase AAA [Alcanivorax sp. PN-3]MBA4723234.1 MoxR family ATPase [Alcanivorax sp.]AFT70895.1 ATPase, AAA family, putative [Alloalcanivorax dieselolei B5]ARB46152.1 AAA family ATPase [Alloalcanivorax xenomutans]MCE7521777.1 MoxR family ATPase [Alloalcanivorax xenomutans]|tara:strand:+ start:2087 stop:2995 length:909 start_codon:yes stop_codon:yes gene_type:complete